MNRAFLLFSFVFVHLLNLQSISPALKTAYKKAGKNKSELKAVIKHYSKHPADSLKKKAAVFLLTNLSEAFSIDGERIKIYSDTVKRYYKDGSELHKKLLLLRDYPADEKLVGDIDVLTSEYLINNIDGAFNTWENCGWKKEISFSNFCEYILPYRIGNEPLESWRKEIIKDSALNTFFNELNRFSDQKTAAQWFTKRYANYQKKFIVQWGSNATNIPDLPYSSLNLLSTGTCANLNQITLLAYRAAGFPTAIDFSPQFTNGGHEWAAIITSKGSIPFTISGNDSLGKYKPDDTTPSKVYRKTFSVNNQSHLKLRGDCCFLPYVFNTSKLMDVTDAYVPTCNANIPSECKATTEKIAYLAVFKNLEWEPIAWGSIVKDVACFPKTPMNTVFMPMLISQSKADYINYPFLINSDSIVQYLKPDFRKLQSLILYRKFPLRDNIKTYIKRMINGSFQASNSADFSDAVTLYTITENPGVYRNEIALKSIEKYRYVRYLSYKYAKCNVAELEFFDAKTGTVLSGAIIGTKGLQPLENAFDGNVLTYFDTDVSKDPRWVGLDLGAPSCISKIAYTSRNDQNHIVIGDVYELFYWDGVWKTLGKKKATENLISFSNVPTNALFLLRNRSRGKEERIFTYENGAQIWR